MDPEVLKAVSTLIVESTNWEGVDLIVSVEAMGLPLLAAGRSHGYSDRCD